MMPVPIEFLRGVLGVVGLGGAFMAGRSAVLVRKGIQKVSTLYGWILRCVICLAVLAFRQAIDTVVIAVWALAVVAFALGMWTTSHRKPPEDLSQEIFPQ